MNRRDAPNVAAESVDGSSEKVSERHWTSPRSFFGGPSENFFRSLVVPMVDFLTRPDDWEATAQEEARAGKAN
jgi:hypothetical protein